MTTTQNPPPTGQTWLDRFAWLPYLLVAMSMLFFAGNTVIGRAMHVEMALVFWRQIGAMVLLAPFCHREARRKWPLIRQHWRLIAVIGLTQVVTGQGMIYAGLQTTTAINTGVIGTTQAPLILVVAWLLYGSTVSRAAGGWLGRPNLAGDRNQEAGSRHDPDVLERIKRKQVAISRHDTIGLSGKRGFEKFVIIRVAASLQCPNDRRPFSH